MELRNSLESSFSMQLPGTLIFDYPTAEAIALLISSRLPPPPFPPSAAQHTGARRAARLAQPSAAAVPLFSSKWLRGAGKGAMIVAPPVAAVVGMCVRAATGDHGLAQGFSGPLQPGDGPGLITKGSPADGVGGVPLAR